LSNPLIILLGTRSKAQGLRQTLSATQTLCVNRTLLTDMFECVQPPEATAKDAEFGTNNIVSFWLQLKPPCLD
jgi:hypothetical protein